MNKVAVVGVSCSGKTTFGMKLAARFGLRFTDLDDLFWNPGWAQTEPELFLEKVKDVLKGNKWIIVGNYKSVQESVLNEADTIIWLDYSKSVVWRQALTRTMKRAFFKEPCCNGNIESLKISFFSKNSILLWVYKDYPRKKKRYEALLKEGAFKNKNFIRIDNPKAAEEFIHSYGR